MGIFNALFGGSDGSLGDADRAQLARLEHKLDLILAHLRIPVAPAAPGTLAADVQELVARGEKIAAIKRHRELTGLGLKEAKDAVEAYDPLA